MREAQVVVFSLNNQYCGVETSQVQSIIRYQDVSKVPEMPDFVEGIINLRGKIIPVINLNKRFNLGDTKVTDSTKIIVSEVDNSPIGFVVNNVSEIMKFTEEELEPAPDIIYNAGNTYISNIGKKEDKLVSILDFGKILTSKEMDELKA